MEAIIDSIGLGQTTFVTSYGGAGHLEGTKSVATFIWQHAPQMTIAVHRDPGLPNG